jgi:hypothetical protein
MGGELMRKSQLLELADLWENESIGARLPELREMLREHVDILRMLASMNVLSAPVIDTTLASDRAPTHRCKACGAYWMEWSTNWSLVSRQCGQCCDNVPMGDQILPLVMSDLYRRTTPTKDQDHDRD